MATVGPMGDPVTACARAREAIRYVHKARQDAVAAANNLKRLRASAIQLLNEPVFPHQHFANSLATGLDEPAPPEPPST